MSSRRSGYLHGADAAKLKARNLHMPAGRYSVFDTATFEAPFLIASPLAGFGGHIGAFSNCQSIVLGVGRIGRYCAIATDVHLGGVEHPWNWAAMSSFTYDPTYIWKPYLDSIGRSYRARPLTRDPKRHGLIDIGNDVWIGQGACIRRGVKIGDGAVIGAHAVVTKDVEPYAMVAGNPARVIRKRFSDALIALLQASRWWDYAFPDFDGLPVEEPEQFCRKVLELAEQGIIKPYRPQVLTGTDLARMLRPEPQNAGWSWRRLWRSNRRDDNS
jgi:acetyltransferase-like isoleucine patch superfamily enzyme